MNNFRVRSLYDLMGTNEKMVSSMVKQQLNHYRIRKVSDEECKSLLAWWKAHESQFSYVAFVGLLGHNLRLKGYSTLSIYAQACDSLDWA